MKMYMFKKICTSHEVFLLIIKIKKLNKHLKFSVIFIYTLQLRFISFEYLY